MWLLCESFERVRDLNQSINQLDMPYSPTNAEFYRLGELDTMGYLDRRIKGHPPIQPGVNDHDMDISPNR